MKNLRNKNIKIMKTVCRDWSYKKMSEIKIEMASKDLTIKHQYKDTIEAIVCHNMEEDGWQERHQ